MNSAISKEQNDEIITIKQKYVNLFYYNLLHKEIYNITDHFDFPSLIKISLQKKWLLVSSMTDDCSSSLHRKWFKKTEIRISITLKLYNNSFYDYFVNILQRFCEVDTKIKLWFVYEYYSPLENIDEKIKETAEVLHLCTFKTPT